MKSVELAYEAVDKIVVDELKDAIVALLYDPYENAAKNPHICHLMNTLQYMTDDADYRKFFADHPTLPQPIGDWDMYVEEIHENADGSCAVSCQIGDKLKDHLISSALRTALMEMADAAEI